MSNRIVRSAMPLVCLVCLLPGASAVAQGIHVQHEGITGSEAPSVSDLLSPAQLLEANGGDGVGGQDVPDPVGDFAKETGAGLAIPPGPDENLNGTDPAATGCSKDAVTKKYRALFASNGQKAGVIELRYSPTCRSAWGRITSSYVVCQSTRAWCGTATIHRNDGLKYTPLCPAKPGHRGCYTYQLNDAGYRSYASGCMTTYTETVCGRTEAY